MGDGATDEGLSAASFSLCVGLVAATRNKKLLFFVLPTSVEVDTSPL